MSVDLNNLLIPEEQNMQVKLEQGLQMLTIFKNHEAETSILEDFDFYEQREKALQENRCRQQPVSTEPHKSTNTKAGLVDRISNAFVQSVQLKDTETNGNKTTAEGASAQNGSASTAKMEEGNANLNTGPVEESS
jgi:YTH domain-containing family protein